MEFMPSSRRRLETADRIQLSNESVERAADEILENQEVVHDLAEKIREKIEFKDQISTDDGTNTPADWKRLGGLIVNQHKFPQKVADALKEHGVDIYDDESVLELHVPPQTADLSTFPHSMTRLYQYLKANIHRRGAPLYIYGVSYLLKPLESLVKRYNFRIVDLPESVKTQTGAARLLETYSHSENPNRKKIAEKFTTDDIQLCYVTVDDFLEAYEKLHPEK